MSTVLASHLGSYAQSVARFQAASAGLYPGPSMPMSLLGDLVTTTDGLNTASLKEAVVLAAGKHRAKDKGNGFGDFLTEIALGLGGGMVVEFLQNFQFDHDDEADDREELVDDAHRCADAIDDTVSISSSAIAEMLNAGAGIIDALSAVLVRRSHVIMQYLAPALVSIGDRVIESTNSSVASTCRDRDDTIERCYELLESRCECVCTVTGPSAPAVPTEPTAPEAPTVPASSTESTPKVICDVEKKEPDKQAPARTQSYIAPANAVAPAVSVSLASPQPYQCAEAIAHVCEASPTQETVPQSAFNAPDVATRDEAGECDWLATDIPQQDIQHQPLDFRTVDCEHVHEDRGYPVTQEPVGVHQCVDVTDDTGIVGTANVSDDMDADTVDVAQGAKIEELAVENGCAGILGGLGIGIAVVGIGAVTAVAAQWIADHADQIDAFLHPDQPAPDQFLQDQPAQEEPAPAPTPMKEEEVKSTPPPLSDGVIAPPEQLSTVAEPTPPAQKVEMMQEQEASAGASESLDSVDSVSPAPQSGGSSTNASTGLTTGSLEGASQGSSSRTRKAGQW